jgi:REP element-mobilizing transposase RayT
MAEELARVESRDSPECLRLQRSIFREMEQWLDLARWAPHFSTSEVATMTVEAIEHRKARGAWQMFAYVVMPTHLHLFCEFGSLGLQPTLKDFKRWTGHRGIAMISDPTIDDFWQREWFDHWSRSDEEDDRIVAYIQNNPVKAGLVMDYRQWPYGSWSKA